MQVFSSDLTCTSVQVSLLFNVSILASDVTIQHGRGEYSLIRTVSFIRPIDIVVIITGRHNHLR